MKNKSRFIYIGIVVATAFLIVGGRSVFRGFLEYEKEVSYYTPMPNVGAFHSLKEVKPRRELAESDSIFLNVPFTSQASTGNWDNIVFQQGCEEASVLMAMLWVEGKQLGSEEAAKAILAISRFEQDSYGEFRDASAYDTAKFMRDYFEYEKGEVKYDIGAEDIKRELGNGNLVIAPVNGQKMGNPFYTPPGPIQHMVVIRGYDTKTKEFIVNDPGTRRGEGFRYPEDILDQALQDYETGYKEPLLNVRKAMIVIKQ